MKSKSIPFGNRSIELSCAGDIKEYPAEEEFEYYAPRKPNYPHEQPQATFIEEKTSKWKDLQDSKKQLLNRMTDFVKLYLEIKLTKTDAEEKALVQDLISSVNIKMGEANSCKDPEILKEKFPNEEDYMPLEITLDISSSNELDYSYLSNLLSTFGKVESLVISENKQHAQLKFSSISSSIRVNL